MNISEIVITQLAFFSYREGQRLSSGCRSAMAGIAHVFRNRVEAGWGNGDWLRILADAPIHSASLLGEFDFGSYIDIREQTFRWLHTQCSGIFDGTIKDDITIAADTRWTGTNIKVLPKRALFYANIQMPMRSWFTENILKRTDEHPRTADAGTVTFYA